ncbi:hypothetical protein AAY473_010797 [Plecturocebus cupreus]
MGKALRAGRARGAGSLGRPSVLGQTCMSESGLGFPELPPDPASHFRGSLFLPHPAEGAMGAFGALEGHPARAAVRRRRVGRARGPGLPHSAFAERGVWECASQGLLSGEAGTRPRCCGAFSSSSPSSLQTCRVPRGGARGAPRSQPSSPPPSPETSSRFHALGHAGTPTDPAPRSCQLGFKELAKLGRSGSAWLRVGAPSGRTTQTANSMERGISLPSSPSASSALCVRLTTAPQEGQRSSSAFQTGFREAWLRTRRDKVSLYWPDWYDPPTSASQSAGITGTGKLSPRLEKLPVVTPPLRGQELGRGSVGTGLSWFKNWKLYVLRTILSPWHTTAVRQSPSLSSPGPWTHASPVSVRDSPVQIREVLAKQRSPGSLEAAPALDSGKGVMPQSWRTRVLPSSNICIWKVRSLPVTDHLSCGIRSSLSSALREWCWHGILCPVLAGRGPLLPREAVSPSLKLSVALGQKLASRENLENFQWIQRVGATLESRVP